VGFGVAACTPSLIDGFVTDRAKFVPSVHWPCLAMDTTRHAMRALAALCAQSLFPFSNEFSIEFQFKFNFGLNSIKIG
jgi:hypothetical protein